MPTSSDLELRRQLEEPLGGEHRNYPTVDDRLLVTMFDTPYYPPYMPDAIHAHNYLEIGVCLSGSGQVSLGDKAWPYFAGSLIVAPRGVYHSQTNTGEPLTHWRYLVISDDYLARHTPERYRRAIVPMLDPIRDTGAFFENTTDSALHTLFNMMYDLRRRDSANAPLEMELCLYLLLIQIAQQLQSMPLDRALEPVELKQREPIEPALTYVYEHYKEDIQVIELARSCSMSESYFRKQFLRIMGMSPLEHVNRYRVHRAMNLLITTTDSIQNIAVRAGFSSVAAFNRNFRQYASCSPSAWRRSRITK